MRYVFSVINQKIYSAKVSYCQNSDIREVSIALVLLSAADPGLLQHLLMERFSTIVYGFKWIVIALKMFHFPYCRGLRPTS